MSGDLLKVLYCSFDVIPDATGTSARATGFLKGLGSRFGVDALTLRSPDRSHIERLHGVRLMRVPVGAGDVSVRAQAFERAVRRQLESDEYAIVHFTDPYGGYALCELRQHHAFKLVYEVVGFPSIEVKYAHPELESDRRFLAKLRRQELFCLMNADAVLVGSEQTAAMVQSLGVSPERTTVIRANVDPGAFDAARSRPDRAPMRLLYLGNQNPWQGLPTLLSAMAIAIHLCEVRLAIIGPSHPTWRRQLEEKIAEYNLAKHVEIMDAPAPEHLARVLASADVGLAPLEKNDRNCVQGAPVSKIATYLAAGRPVLATNLPIVREITQPGCAVYHEPGDVDELAERIVNLSRDPARRVAMGEYARTFAARHLNGDRARADLLALYEKLLGAAAASSQNDLAEEPSSAPTSIGAAVPGGADDAPTPTGKSAVASSFEHITDPFKAIDAVEPAKAAASFQAVTPVGPPAHAAPQALPARRAPSAAPESPLVVAASTEREAPEAEAAEKEAGDILSWGSPADVPWVVEPPQGEAEKEAALARLGLPVGDPAASRSQPEEVFEVEELLPKAAPAPAPAALAPAPAPAPAPASAAPAPAAAAEEGPVEVDAADIEMVPPGEGPRTPPSGLPPSEEWLGHLLHGYAPFGVAIVPIRVGPTKP